METQRKVFSITSEVLKIPTETIGLKSNLIDLVEDSIQLFELLIRFEKEIGQKISYEDIVSIETVEDIISFAHQKSFV